MFLFTLMYWMILREIAILQGLQELRSSSEGRVRYLVLDAIHKYDGIRDPRVLEYYRGLWKDRHQSDPNRRIDFISELTTPRFFSKDVKSLVFEFLRSSPEMSITFLPKLYTVRNTWWNDREMVSFMNVSLKKFYIVVWQEINAPTGKSAPLLHWTRMCEDRAMLGDKTMISVLESNLHDTRQIKDLRGYAGTLIPRNPIPSRVCDHMLLALLKLGQVDIPALFAQYGYRNIKMREYHESMLQLYDQMIKDYPEIKKQYLLK